MIRPCSLSNPLSMNKAYPLILLAALTLPVVAQQATRHAAADDPVLMVVNGKPVLRSEFVYSYKKNSNVQGAVERKTVQEYVPMFLDYKLKVAAAEAARLDTLTSFKNEFTTYRDMQLTPYLVDSAYIDSVAHVVYDNTAKELGGKDLIRVSHILIRVGSKATDAEREAAKAKADSLSNLLKGGADFAELARKYSQDPSTAVKGGQLPLAGPGSFVKEFEDAAYALKNSGDVSALVLSPFGYHLIQLNERKPLDPFQTVKPQILAMLKRQNIEEASSEHRIEQLVKASGGRLTREAVLDSVMNAHINGDTALRYLIQEYHDGLLLYEVSKRQVWDVAQSDTLGLEKWYKEHKAQYTWTKPRFSGYVYFARTSTQAKLTKKTLKAALKSGDDWRKEVNKAVNKDSVCVKLSGPYLCSQGENGAVDAVVFKVKGAKASGDNKDYPFSGYYGKVLKQPKTWLDVKPQVTADYQDQMEKAWVASLRQRFTYTINEDVVKTVEP